MSFATASISGRLLTDPEFKDIGDSKVVNFTIIRDQWNGNNREQTPQYWDCEIWGNLSKMLRAYQKGHPISVDGDLVQNKSEKDGNTRTFYKVKVFKLGDPIPKRYIEAAGESTGNGGSSSQGDDLF
jgi:single-stranded DNA-binding protein